MKLFCATTNAGKLREFALILEHCGKGSIEWEPLPNLAGLPPCDETGATFEENAILKACYYGSHAAGLLFADDSGLEVDALGGAPGVRSARYAGSGATDRQNNELLLERLRQAGATKPEQRTARFVCCIALSDRGRLVRTFHGAVEGWILSEARGSEGFGYDPLFYFPELAGSFGEVSAQQKLRVSHRGKALAEMVHFLLA